MLETRVQSLIWEDPTCHGAVKPRYHTGVLSPCATTTEACVLQQEETPQWEACKERVSPLATTREKAYATMKTQHGQKNCKIKISKLINQKKK